METAQITTAKILTYLTVLVDEAKNSGGYTPTIQEKFTQAMNMWLNEETEECLRIPLELSKDLLPLIHSEWQQRPSFSVYMLNAKAEMSDNVPLSLASVAYYC